MAEEAASSNSSATVEPQQEQKSGWWGGFFDTVKKKSEVILNAYKEDLSEFASSIKSDAQKVVASDLTSTISNQINKITETISTLITDEKNSGSTESRSNENYNTKLESLQTSSETFTMKPEDVAFFQWTETFDVEAKSEEISKILANNAQISEMYHQMVPSVLSMKEFWGRYFYKLEKINQEEARRAALVKKAEELQQNKADELALGWGDDDDSETQTPAIDTSNTEDTKTNESAPSQELQSEDDGKSAETDNTPTESSTEPADKEEKIIPDSEGDKKSEGGDDDIFSWS